MSETMLAYFCVGCGEQTRRVSPGSGVALCGPECEASWVARSRAHEETRRYEQARDERERVLAEEEASKVVLEGVREHNAEEEVAMVCPKFSGYRDCIRVVSEDGVYIDLLDLIDWLKANRPDLLES